MALSYFLHINLIANGKGIVKTKKAVDVRSEIEGIVKKVLIKDNQNITKDSVLLHLENRKGEIELKEAEVEILEIESKIQKLNYQLINKANAQSLEYEKGREDLKLLNISYDAKKRELLTDIRRLKNKIELKAIETHNHLERVNSYLHVIQLFRANPIQNGHNTSTTKERYVESMKSRFQDLVEKFNQIGIDFAFEKLQLRFSIQKTLSNHPTIIEQKIKKSLLDIDKAKAAFTRIKQLRKHQIGTEVELYDAEFQVKNKRRYFHQLKSEVFEQIWEDLTTSSVQLKEIDILTNELNSLLESSKDIRASSSEASEGQRDGIAVVKKSPKVICNNKKQEQNERSEFDHFDLKVIRAKIEQAKLSKKRILFQQKELTSIKKELHNLEQRLQAEKQAYEILKKENKLLIVKSPINGYILTHNTVSLLGKRFEPGQSMLRIGDTSSYVVEAKIEETEFPLVKKDQKAKVRIIPFPKGEYRYYNATVDSVGVDALENGVYAANSIREDPGEFPVVLKIHPPYGVTIFDEYYELKPGYSADVEIITQHERFLNLFVRRVLRIKGELSNSNLSLSSLENENQMQTSNPENKSTEAISSVSQ